MFKENPEMLISIVFCSFHFLGWCILFHLFLEVCSVTRSPPKNSGESYRRFQWKTLLWAWYTEVDNGSYVILILFQATETWLDMNLLEIYEKKTKIFR